MEPRLTPSKFLMIDSGAAKHIYMFLLLGLMACMSSNDSVIADKELYLFDHWGKSLVEDLTVPDKVFILINRDIMGKRNFSLMMSEIRKVIKTKKFKSIVIIDRAKSTPRSNTKFYNKHTKEFTTAVVVRFDPTKKISTFLYMKNKQTILYTSKVNIDHRKRFDAIAALISSKSNMVDLSPGQYPNNSAKVFMANCMNCHDGVRNAPDLEKMLKRGEHNLIVKSILQGRMPPWGIAFHNPYVKKRFNGRSSEKIINFIENSKFKKVLKEKRFKKKEIHNKKTVLKIKSLISADSDFPVQFFPVVQIKEDVKFNLTEIAIDKKVDFNYLSLRITSQPFSKLGGTVGATHELLVDPPAGLGVIASWHYNKINLRKTGKNQYFYLKKGQHLVLELYHGKEKIKYQKAEVTITLSDTEDKKIHEIKFKRFDMKKFSLPMGSKRLKRRSEYKLDKDLYMITVKPTLRFFGRSVSMGAINENGVETEIFSIPRYSMNFHRGYTFKKPLFFPKGTTLWIEGVYDTTLSGTTNMSRNKQHAWPLEDEMLRFSFKYFTPEKVIRVQI